MSSDMSNVPLIVFPIFGVIFLIVFITMAVCVATASKRRRNINTIPYYQPAPKYTPASTRHRDLESGGTIVGGGYTYSPQNNNGFSGDIVSMNRPLPPAPAHVNNPLEVDRRADALGRNGSERIPTSPITRRETEELPVYSK